MTNSALTGSRIRERREMLALKQSEVAREIGISPAYLNLIEHNRRRIGGRLLNALAARLGVEAAQLAEGADTALVEGLRAAAGDPPPGLPAGTLPETDRTEEFAGRFPGWAALVEAQARRIAALERTVATLTDRLTHDPFLSASMHDVLSTVTAIRSSAGILVDTPDIDREWRARFNRNIYEDSQRLAEGAQSLVRYLDGAGAAEPAQFSPQEEIEAWLERTAYHMPEIERRLPASDAAVLATARLESQAARALALGHLARYRRDAALLPLGPFQESIAEIGPDPARLAERFGTDLACVLRRLASLPPGDDRVRPGLVICDASGTLTFRKPIDGFAMPRFGAACPLWPLYQALNRPMTPLRALLDMPGRDTRHFLAYAIAQPAGAPDFDAPPVFEATMLILPPGAAPHPDGPAAPVGTSCRICPRASCAARREPSILGEVV